MNQQAFDTGVIFAIAANSALMALEDPLEDPENLSDQAQLFVNRATLLPCRALLAARVRG
eukprot:SAG31_NODE_13773_length_847_cov_1.681818_2_plen_60_part_00